MPLWNFELARMTTATVGTGTITLGTAVTGFKSFAGAGVANSNEVFYGIRDGAHSEIGYGTYTSSGTTLSRNVIKSTNSDNPISLSGTAEVFIGPFAAVLAAIDATAVHLAGAETISGKKTFTALNKFQALLEKVTITADNPASGDNNFDVLTQAFQYYTTANDTNWTLNVRGDGSNSLDSIMATGESITIALMVTNTGTAYYQSGFKIDGNSVTPQWLGAAAPSAGTVNKRDLYTFTIIKTGSATFVVEATFGKGF